MTGQLARLVRNRSVRLATGFAMAIAVPVATLVYFEFRSLGDLERTSAIVLETLSRQTADTLEKTLEFEFTRPSYDVERLDHKAIDRFDLPRLARQLQQFGRSSDLVDAYYFWALASPSGGADVLEWSARGADSDPARPQAGFHNAGPEAELLKAIARESSDVRLTWGTRVHDVNGRRQVLVVHLLFDSSARDRLTSFVAFRVDVDRLRTAYLPRVIGPRLDEANHRVGLARLSAAVVDADGRIVFSSDSAQAARGYLDERQVPLVFYDQTLMPVPEPCAGCRVEWRVLTGYGGTPVDAIAHASTANHRALLVALVLAIVAGLAVTLRQAVQQVRLSDAKASFVANVSHDLKTPLALIQLFAETLELGRVRSGAKAREYYAIINSEAKKLSALINNVLDFSKIESGFRMWRLAPVDIGEIVQGVVQQFEPQFVHQRFEVSVRIASGLPEVMADAEAVELAVGNLLSNAMKYSGEARQIEVDLARDAAHLLVRVADHGIGIPRRMQSRIFEKFFRIEDSAEAPRGCGLGLAIVEQVMQAHGGRVTVDSEPGRGSTFTLRFPIPKERPASDEADSRNRRRAPDAAGVA